jgi:hypothetical protein
MSIGLRYHTLVFDKFNNLCIIIHIFNTVINNIEMRINNLWVNL